MTTKTQANEVALEIINTTHNSTRRGKIYYDLDCEWNTFDGTQQFTQTLSLSFGGQNIEFFDFTMMDVWKASNVPPQVKKLLEVQNLVSCERNIGVDLAWLCLFGIKIKQWVELRGLALSHDNVLNCTTLHFLCKNHLRLTIDKFGQTADYSVSSLPPELVEYASLDILVSCLVAEFIIKLSPTSDRNIVFLPDTESWKDRQNISTWLRSL